MSLMHFDDKSFKQEVLNSEIPVLVDFWAEWCGPCKMLNPILEEIAKEYKGKIKVGKVNVDENRKAPSDYGIMSIPTLMFFKDGKILEQFTGAFSKAQLKNKIEANL